MRPHVRLFSYEIMLSFKKLRNKLPLIYAVWQCTKCFDGL